MLFSNNYGIKWKKRTQFYDKFQQNNKFDIEFIKIQQ